MDKKKIGIIGGMGPMATVDLFRRLVEHTDANTDAEHIHIIIDNYPQIPDRTQAILTGDNSIVPFLVESGKRLENAGAELLLIPCNTSHYFYDSLCAELKIPVLHMIRECAKKVLSLGYSKVALLATDGVVFSGVYGNIFREFGIEILLPGQQGQRQIMNLIYQEIKAGKLAHPEALSEELNNLEKQGAQAFILGCTELPLAFSADCSRAYIDPAAILAEVAICAAGYEYRQ